MAIYGTNLKALRERFGLSQSKCGKIINLDSGTYAHYEQEDLLMPLKHLVTMCNYFNVSLDYIFGFTKVKRYKNLVKDYDVKKIGFNLKTFRKEIDITQKELALVLNTTQSVIADYERGRYLIATPFLYSICKNYKISADYLLGRIDKKIRLK